MTPRRPPPPAFVAFLLLALLAVCPLAAQVTPAPLEADSAASSPSEETVFSLIFKGGWLMVPIGLCSIIILTYTIERTISLRRSRTIPTGLLDELLARLPGEDSGEEARQEAVGLLDSSRSLLGSLLRPAVQKLDRGAHLVETILAETASKQVHLLKRRIRPFAVVTSLAPLLGLLGTIFGMITCFENAASADAASRAESLAKGIYAALVTTAAGLSVAIPSYVLYHYFLGRVDRIVDELEESATTFVEHVLEENDTSGATPESPGRRGGGAKRSRGGGGSPAASESAPLAAGS